MSSALSAGWVAPEVRLGVFEVRAQRKVNQRPSEAVERPTGRFEGLFLRSHDCVSHSAKFLIRAAHMLVLSCADSDSRLSGDVSGLVGSLA